MIRIKAYVTYVEVFKAFLTQKNLSNNGHMQDIKELVAKTTVSF